MTRAEEVQQGCDAIPHLVVACHCGDDCPDRPTHEGVKTLRSAVRHVENGLEFLMAEAGRNNATIGAAVDVLERIEGLDCEACNNCSEFSSYRCETCSEPLAGARHALARIYPGTDQEPVYYSSCIDCLVYVWMFLHLRESFDLANGDLPEDDE